MDNGYRKYLAGKVILITGGTGSFGPKRVIIFSRDEKKQEDMRNHYAS